MRKLELVLFMPFWIVAYIVGAIKTNLKLGYRNGKDNHEEY